MKIQSKKITYSKLRGNSKKMVIHFSCGKTVKIDKKKKRSSKRKRVKSENGEKLAGTSLTNFHLGKQEQQMQLLVYCGGY